MNDGETPELTDAEVETLRFKPYQGEGYHSIRPRTGPPLFIFVDEISPPLTPEQWAALLEYSRRKREEEQ